MRWVEYFIIFISLMVGFILFALQKFIPEFWKNVFKKDLSNHNANNQKKIYVSKVKFYAEFEMYQKLSKSCFKMVLETSKLFQIFEYSPSDEKKREEYNKNKYKEAEEQICVFQDDLYMYAPFISENIYELLLELHKIAMKQESDYFELYITKNLGRSEIKTSETHRDRERLMSLHSEFIKELRIYLNNLDVIGK